MPYVGLAFEADITSWANQWSYSFFGLIVVLARGLLSTRPNLVYAYSHRTLTYGPYGGTATAAQLAAAMDIPATLIVNTFLSTFLRGLSRACRRHYPWPYVALAGTDSRSASAHLLRRAPHTERGAAAGGSRC